MRIVHLSTGHQGGAGLAARRLSGGLQAAGVDSRFVAFENRAYRPKENEFQVKRDFRQRLEVGISTYVSRKFTEKTLVTPISANVIDRKYLRELTENEETIFHVHNWFNLFSQKNLFEFSREFNFILTLHDQRAFTAACHYSLGCEKFKSKCTQCPQLPKIFDQLLIRSNQKQVLSDLNFVTPSQWLMELANSSNLFKECYGEVIPNSFFGYEGEVTPVSKLRTKFRIGFAAMDSNSWIKGGDLVSALMMKYSDGTKYEFLVLADYKDYRDFWNSIDLLLVPSRADNSPNVIHEAKLWGIPVISSNVGGIPEILSPGFDKSIRLEDLSVDSIESEIEQVVKTSLSTDLRQKVAKIHRQYLDTSISKHLKLYENTLRKKCFDRGK